MMANNNPMEAGEEGIMQRIAYYFPAVNLCS